ncbi:Concanavalin A-like lectin/glucanases superfamily protein [Cnuella takakiae]|uniref:Concanavalin A-like lectin/glucanases superfamily protein n=2 Tax=Cnuella takakiae TaxID=1302690 RepID=A0A1M4ZHG3_9BACT|nr:LamG domain-containing protein [Cnuella takakiae]SHF17479.1 Concanavalin A-like lectin/glucanases superfamily protein [Cnuella takakiae]
MKKLFILGSFLLALGACQKMDRPSLGDYAQDTNPPGGPLKFYAAFDGRSLDSIRAVFGADNNVSFVDGISGKAMSAGANGYVVFPSTNEFKTASDFTVAFWVKKAGPNPAGGGAAFAFGLSTETDIWTRQDMFLLFEDAGNPSSTELAAAKFYLNDQWFEFVRTPAMDRRLPKVLDGQWHHLAFVFDQTTSTLTTYVDGAAFTNLPPDFGRFNNNSGKVNFSKSAGVVVGGPGHYAVGKTPDTWMGNFNGQIDQFRMYGKTLTAQEVQALFTGKQ